MPLVIHSSQWGVWLWVRNIFIIRCNGENITILLQTSIFIKAIKVHVIWSYIRIVFQQSGHKRSRFTFGITFQRTLVNRYSTRLSITINEWIFGPTSIIRTDATASYHLLHNAERNGFAKLAKWEEASPRRRSQFHLDRSGDHSARGFDRGKRRRRWPGTLQRSKRPSHPRITCTATLKIT